MKVISFYIPSLPLKQLIIEQDKLIGLAAMLHYFSASSNVIQRINESIRDGHKILAIAQDPLSFLGLLDGRCFSGGRGQILNRWEPRPASVNAIFRGPALRRKVYEIHSLPVQSVDSHKVA